MSSVVEIQHQSAATAPPGVSVANMPGEVAILPDGHPAMIAIENSSPEVIHVVNVPNSMTTPNNVSQIVTMPAGAAAQPGVQTITLSAGNFTFPISVATPLVSAASSFLSNSNHLQLKPLHRDLCAIGGFTVTSYAVSRGRLAPMVGKRFVIVQKRGKRRELWLHMVSCKQWEADVKTIINRACRHFTLISGLLLQHISTHLTSQKVQQPAVFYAAKRINECCHRRHASGVRDSGRVTQFRRSACVNKC